MTLDLTSLLPWPLKEDDSHKQQSTATKHYRIQQYIGKKKSGLTPPMPYKPVKSKYALYINQHWYLSNWDNEGTYFTLGLPLPDIDSHNGSTQGRAPHGYKDVPIFTEYHTSSGSKEEDPINEQI